MTPEPESSHVDEQHQVHQLLEELRSLLVEREGLCTRIADIERRSRKLERERNALAVRANRLQSRIVSLREHAQDDGEPTHLLASGCGGE